MRTPETADQDLGEAVKSVVAALEKPDQPLAVRLARTALASGLVHPLFLNLRAFWLEGRGRLREALADLERAHELAPDDVPVLNALGLARAKLQRPIEATQAFEAAIALDPNFTPAHFNHGWACEMWGELDRARKSYARAAELSAGQPGAAESLARLATLATRRGDWEEARDLATRALELSPAHPIAQMARARAEMQVGNFDAADAQLQRILMTPTLSHFDRYHAMGALGDLRHLQKDYVRAYQAYEIGNAEYRRNTSPGEYGETVLDAFDWMRRYFESLEPASAPAARPAPQADEPRCHIFLLGFIRSGTTLLEQALASHPDVVTMEEKDVMGDSAPVFMANAQSIDRLRALGSEERTSYAQAYWRRVREIGIDPGGQIFVDKQPFNTVKLPLIAELFPDAKIIFAVRDPRDVLLSCIRRRLSINPMTYELLTLETAARFYDSYMRLADRMRAVLPLQLHQIRHEDLVDDFEGETRKLCDFLGIAWNDTMRNFAEHRKVRAISSPSAAQIAKGLNREGMGQWRRYREQMAPILPILAPWVAHFGYPVD